MTLSVSIDAQGNIYVGSEPVVGEQLTARFQAAVAQDPKVEMHLQADRDVRYEVVAETMSAARRAGLTKIGFITQPTATPQ